MIHVNRTGKGTCVPPTPCNACDCKDFRKPRLYRKSYPVTDDMRRIECTGPVDLHLTRKDAIQLTHILTWCVPNCITHNTVDGNYNSSTGQDKILSAKRILNKLKREGVR